MRRYLVVGFKSFRLCFVREWDGIQADVFRQRLLLLLLVNQNPILLLHRVTASFFVAGDIGFVRFFSGEIKPAFRLTKRARRACGGDGRVAVGKFICDVTAARACGHISDGPNGGTSGHE